MLHVNDQLHYSTHCIFLLSLLLTLGEAIDFYAQIVTRFLPKDLTVGNIEQILISYFISARNQTFFWLFKKIVYADNLDVIQGLKTHFGISSKVTLAGTSLSSGTQ